ncbi:MAG: hypothetical protein AAF583_02695 [Pseudomonadota bacterium]
MRDDLVAYYEDVSERASEIRWVMNQVNVGYDPAPLLMVEAMQLAANYPDKIRAGYSFQDFSADLNDYIFGENTPAYAKNLFEGVVDE